MLDITVSVPVYRLEFISLVNLEKILYDWIPKS